jgi:hypothetical protein
MKMAQEAAAEELGYILAPPIQPHAPINVSCWLFNHPSVSIGIAASKLLQTLYKDGV